MFEVTQGEVVVIIGRNGAGKSTLLKILSRITEPTAGQIALYGRLSSLLEVGTGFHPELTGRENTYLSGSILGMKRAEIDLRFDEIVAFAEVEQFIDTPVKHYSSGMYLRLAFAVAAHLNPEILVVDEVLAVGDINFQKKCLGKMDDVSKQGRTIVFVSHNMAAMRRLCGTVLWLEQGAMVKRGDAATIVQEYEQHMLGTIDTSLLTAVRDEAAIEGEHSYVKSVSIYNARKELHNHFKYGEHLYLDVVFSHHNVGTAFSPEFYIYNELGILVAVGASGPYHGKYFSHKVRRIQIAVGPLFLTSGHYRILLSIMVGDSRVDTWDNAIGFTIDECKPFDMPWDIPANREGVCAIEHAFSEAE